MIFLKNVITKKDVLQGAIKTLNMKENFLKKIDIEKKDIVSLPLVPA